MKTIRFAINSIQTGRKTVLTARIAILIVWRTAALRKKEMGVLVLPLALSLWSFSRLAFHSVAAVAGSQLSSEVVMVLTRAGTVTKSKMNKFERIFNPLKTSVSNLTHLRLWQLRQAWCLTLRAWWSLSLVWWLLNQAWWRHRVWLSLNQAWWSLNQEWMTHST